MNIIPTPKKVTYVSDETQRIELTPSICKQEAFADAIDVFTSYMKEMYQTDLAVTTDATICLEKVKEMKPEAYRITVCKTGITVCAGEKVGMNHAFATLLQMLQVRDGKLLVPEMVIEDAPDAKYRGMMIDLARSWHPFRYLLAYVDMCYFYKVAVLQLHFTDDEGYTLPSALYPELSTKGKSYTKEEIEELVAYAEARGVQLMPEIDVPGHCRSFQEAYGEVFGTSGVICQHAESIEAMKALFRELCDMFPYSKYIHLGGDEAYTKIEWTRCPQCLEYAKHLGIDIEMEDKEMLAQLLYANFITEMANACFEKGRQPIVWEGFAKEVNDKISKDIWVMSWENFYQTTPDLLEGGFQIINCSWDPMYVVEPKAMWTQEELYQWSIYQWKAIHPESPYLNKEYRAPKDAPILGGQLLAWGDHIVKDFEPVIGGIEEERQHLLERLPMLAENTWNVEKQIAYSDLKEKVSVLNNKMNVAFCGNSYQNPLSSELDTADPCVVYSPQDKCYYGISTGNTTLTMHRAKKLNDLFRNSESVIVYEAKEEDETYGFLWAPELHCIDGRWYIYTSTHHKNNKGFKHVICLQAKTDNPFDGFELGGHLNPEVLGIDPTVYQDKKNHKLYLCFSIVDDGKQAVTGKQYLAMQEMKSPTEVNGDFRIISEATYDWEKVQPYRDVTINEGAYFIEKDERLFIVYSGNGCWCDDYVLGILEYVGDDMLSADSWVKSETPFLTKGNGNYGPGHATFFYSPDGTELWICHHCLHESNPEHAAMPRHCHCQRVYFDKNGFPRVGVPIPQNVWYEAPSGE